MTSYLNSGIYWIRQANCPTQGGMLLVLHGPTNGYHAQLLIGLKVGAVDKITDAYVRSTGAWDSNYSNWNRIVSWVLGGGKLGNISTTDVDFKPNRNGIYWSYTNHGGILTAYFDACAFQIRVVPDIYSRFYIRKMLYDHGNTEWEPNWHTISIS